MSYSDITFNDKNPFKRWLQKRRLIVAARIGRLASNPRSILDFGAGNGELCKLLAVHFPEARIVCYEPKPELMDEAKANLIDFPHIVFCSNLSEIGDHSIELIFCLEVFEHLPETETHQALCEFLRTLTPRGKAVIGVPIEIGIPALYKGLFRMSRRFGAFDASIKNVVSATFCSPPKLRPVTQIAPEFTFYYDHMGFDFRRLRSQLKARFELIKVFTSPFSVFGVWLNPEANFLIETRESDAA